MADVQPATPLAGGPAAAAAGAEGAAVVHGAERGVAARAALDAARTKVAGAPPDPGLDHAAAVVPPSRDQVASAVKDANQALTASGTQLVFVFDDQLHHMAVKLLDVQTQKVVQQIPPAAMPATASALSASSASGALVDTKA